jgi:hypothetical protein
MHKPSQNHWIATKHLLCYLKQTIFHGIQISKVVTLAFNTFFDADLLETSMTEPPLLPIYIFSWLR